MADQSPNLSRALELMEGDHKDVAHGLLRGKSRVWFGSGISRDVVKSLSQLLEELITRLQDGARPENEQSEAYRDALSRVLAMSGQQLDIAVPIANWEIALKKAVLSQLCDRYAKVFDETVNLHDKSLNLALDILDIVTLYSDTTKTPDTEHYLTALLALEGILPEVITTNWDPFLELAVSDLAGSQDKAHAFSAPEDYANGHSAAPFKVHKIHGCAHAAKTKNESYKASLVYSDQTIHQFLVNQRWHPVREKLRTLIREYDSIFIGLSGQDWNIQADFIATYQLDHNYNHEVAFAELSIGQPQRAVLRAFFAEKYQQGAEQTTAIESKALLGIYAKPLLSALYTITVFSKMRKIVEISKDGIEAQLLADTLTGLDLLKKDLISRYDSIEDESARWRALSVELSRFVSALLHIFRDGAIPTAGKRGEYVTYKPIDGDNLAGIEANAHLPEGSFHQLVILMSSLRIGQEMGKWKVTPFQEDNPFSFGITDGLGLRKFLVVKNSAAHIAAMQNGLVGQAPENTIVIHMTGARPRRVRRQPSRSLPDRKSVNLAKEAYWSEFATDAKSAKDLVGFIESEISGVS